MSEAISDAWELVELIGMASIICLVLLTIAPIAFVYWVTSWKKDKVSVTTVDADKEYEYKLNNAFQEKDGTFTFDISIIEKDIKNKNEGIEK